MHLTTITFPDLRLSTRDGHKLRGYFGRLFGAQSDLWHNHRRDGKPIYRYALIQYKVIKEVPTLVGLAEGAPLLVDHFLDVQEIEIDGLRLPVHSKQVKSREAAIGVQPELYTYRFETPWFALNQENFPKYLHAQAEERKELLKNTLTGHILGFFEGVGHWEEQQILTSPIEMRTVNAHFKNRRMNMFVGRFAANVQLPDLIGLGKSAARGFGTIIRT